MAKIVLGIATSHGPLLTTPPDMWHLRAEWDRSQLHPYQGREHTYEELLATRRAENIAAQITPEERRRRYDACQDAIDRLGRIWTEAKPDVAVIFGYIWAGSQFLAAALNIVVALNFNAVAWASIMSIYHMVTLIGLFLVQYATMRFIGVRRRRAATSAEPMTAAA